MMDYGNLKPGLYLQVGDQIKAIDSLGDIFAPAAAATDAGALAQSVSWSYIALRVRRETAAEIPARWERNGNDAGGVLGVPSPAHLLGRIDTAVQVYGAAYLLKERAGRRVGRLRWLSPASISLPPVSDAGAWDGNEPRYYLRTDASGQRRIDAADIIAISNMGLSETQPATPAAHAVRALLRTAYNLDAISEYTTRNPTPIMLIVVPPGVQEIERNRLRAWFARLLSRDFGERPNWRVLPVSQGVEVRQVGYDLSTLMQSAASMERGEVILSAYGVPMSEATGKAANRSVSDTNRRRLIGRVANACRYYAAIISADPDIHRAGLALAVYPDQHPDMRADEYEIARAMREYTAAGLTPEAAAYRLGVLDGYPDGMQVIAAPPPAPAAEQPPQVRAWLDELARYERKALRAGGACKWLPDALPPEMVGLIGEMLEGARDDAAIRAVFARARALVEADAAQVVAMLREALDE